MDNITEAKITLTDEQKEDLVASIGPALLSAFALYKTVRKYRKGQTGQAIVWAVAWNTFAMNSGAAMNHRAIVRTRNTVKALHGHFHNVQH